MIRCGWHDAATALGALSLFTSCSIPMRVILGPWNHTGDAWVNPFELNSDMHNRPISTAHRIGLITKSLNIVFKEGSDLLENTHAGEYFGFVEYYTLGEDKWKTTAKWPLPQTQMQRLYFSADYQLSHASPNEVIACDTYRADASTSTGVYNRWYCQLQHPVLFPDRQQEDKKLLVYDSPALEENLEITGHPLITLYLRSNRLDGHFFVYLEAVDLDGRVRLLTEGQLRALHRKVSDEIPPYGMFGPFHSMKMKDAEDMIPGEVTEISLDLLPISVLLRKGQRIRVALACADMDTFAPLECTEGAEITVERNKIYASHIDLPVV